jgi:hypothetical protein
LLFHGFHFNVQTEAYLSHVGLATIRTAGAAAGRFRFGLIYAASADIMKNADSD